MSTNFIQQASDETQRLGSPRFNRPPERRADLLTQSGLGAWGLVGVPLDGNEIKFAKYPRAGAAEKGGKTGRPHRYEWYGERVQLSFVDPEINVDLAGATLVFDPQEGQITANVALDRDITLTLEIKGKVGDEHTFTPEEAGLVIQSSGDDARLHFVRSTFAALFALSDLKLRAPNLNFVLHLRFRSPLRDIGEQLRTSKTAYKLMVIGNASGNRMDLPPSLSSRDVENLSFVYHAIVDRTFEWPLPRYYYRPATHDAGMPAVSERPAPMTFVEQDYSQEVLGRLVRIGVMKVHFERAVTRNTTSALDDPVGEGGGQPEVEIISADGKATIECPDAPRLPDAPSSADEERLIALGPRLCDILADRYNELAAATLAGLTDEEKGRVTERPELEDEAINGEASH
jgi:hypothetical protein